VATTFTSVLKTNIINPLEDLIKTEFSKLPIFYDINFKHRGNYFIRVIPVQDELDVPTTEDQLRQYGIVLRLYRLIPGRFTKEQKLTQLIDRVDRIKRLIGNNSNYKPSDVYRWNDAVIRRVNYQPDLEDNESKYQVADMLFTCNVLL